MLPLHMLIMNWVESSMSWMILISWMTRSLSSGVTTDISLGRHAEWGKLTNFKIANRVPMMIHVPGITDKGMRTSKLVELIDIFPTLVDLAAVCSS